MNIETVLLIVIVTFACGFVLDRWNMRLSRFRRRQARAVFSEGDAGRALSRS
jgi:hypothetical protein